MSFENLRLFRDVAQTRSISRAAESNGITPSAASQHINELERSLGALLLDRSTRPLSLTPEGKLYSDLCRDVLRRNDEFRAALNDLKSEIEGTVRIAAIYSVGISEMYELEEEFALQYPHAVLEVDYLRPEKVYEAVAHDDADLGLVSYPEPTKEIAVLPWRDEEMVVTALPDHPLMRNTAIDPKDLQDIDFITFDDDLPISREISRYLKANDIEVNNAMHFDNIQTIKEAVMLGSGVSIVPARILRSEMAAGRLAAVPLKDPGLSRPVGIVYRKKKRFHRAAQAFLDLLQKTPVAKPALTR